MYKMINISKTKPIVGIWGIQDGSDYPKKGWSNLFPTHDHAFCIIDQRGKVQNAIELERITRRKHDRNLSKHIEEFNNYLPKDFIIVSVNDYNGNAFISENGIWRIECDQFEISKLIQTAKATIAGQKREAYVCSHELAHIGSTLPFIGCFENNSLLVHIDGLASQSCFSVFHFKDNKITHIHHGWEPMQVTQIFGFNEFTCSMLGLNEQNRQATPGRLMGYSSFGSYKPEIRDWLSENTWFRDHWKNKNLFFEEANKKFAIDIDNYNLKNEFFMNIACACQKEFEEVIYALIEKYQRKTNAKYLYFTGGAALNIDLNSKLSKSKLFDQVFVPPCCSDTGLALGAASIIHILRNKRMKIHSPFLNSINVEQKKVTKLDQSVLNEVTHRLSLGQIMGVCIGFSECGPRALGHRSIIAIPTHKKIFDIVNTDIKKREWYRPLAPIVSDKLAEDVFIGSTNNQLSKYMLNNFEVNNKWKDKLPAIEHTNNTARAQVVYKNDKDLIPIYQILIEMWDKHQIPCLINTSFNGPGEPIAHTDEDAINCAKKNGINFLLLDNYIMSFKPINYRRI